MDPTVVYVGTYTGPKSQGIYVFRLQTESPEVSQNITLVPLGLAAASFNPSFLELDLKRRLLFAVNEVGQFEGKPTGAVSAFAIDQAKVYNLRSEVSPLALANRQTDQVRAREAMLSFYPGPLLNNQQNRRNRLSPNCSSAIIRR